MSIQALPDSSIRALGSTQAITSPISVLKELIENSIDAGATSISISITPDLLSHIVVKDNGSGIAAADRDVMARPHCTSKLERFEDLDRVKTLGFRGEALASIAQVSGGMSILTKVEGEVLGVKCEIGRDGAVKSQKNAPCSRGTVVTISKLFDHVPVRQAAIEKTASKLITQVGPLLVSYYLTHPGIRFSFQVVPPPEGNKGKKQIDVKHNVIFVANKSIENAIRSSLGSDVLPACLWKEFPTLARAEKALQQVDGYKFEAFLLKRSSGLPLSIRKGAFISLSHRPLSILRPQCIAKKIYSRYKAYLKHACGSQSSVTDPFLYFNIVSTSGKVDVNIEPAKDDVLFEDEPLVMQMVERFFETVYGQLDDMVLGIKNRIVPGDQLQSTDQNFNVLLRGRERTLPEDPEALPSSSFNIPSNQEEYARLNSAALKSHEIPFVDEIQPHLTSDSNTNQGFSQALVQKTNYIISNGNEQHESPNDINDAQVVNSDELPTGSQHTSSEWAFNMYDTGMTEEEMEDLAIRSNFLPQNSAQHVREIEEKNDISTSNPWTFAKLNSTVSSMKRPAIPGSHAIRSASTNNAPLVSGNNNIPSSPSTTGTSNTNSSNIWSSPIRQNNHRAGYASSNSEALKSSSPFPQRLNMDRVPNVRQSLNECQQEEEREERVAPIFRSPVQRNNQGKELWFPKFGTQPAQADGKGKRNSSRDTNIQFTPTKNNSASLGVGRRNPWSPACANMQSEKISDIFLSNKPTNSKPAQKKDNTSLNNVSLASTTTNMQNALQQFFKPVPASYIHKVPQQQVMPDIADDFLDDSDEEAIPQNRYRGLTAHNNSISSELPRQINLQQARRAPVMPQFTPVQYRPRFPQQQQPQDQLQGTVCKLNSSITAPFILSLTHLDITPNFEPAELLLPSNSDGYTAHMLDELDSLSVSMQMWLDCIIAKLDPQSILLNTEEKKLLQRLKNILPPRGERDLQLELLPSSNMAIHNGEIERVIQVKII